jgi:hypothetical protein
MTDDRILGHLAQRFAVSEENIATEALTWLLCRSAAARAALVGLARAIGVDVPDELTFIGQVGSPDTGRPDVVGRDASRERLLIEAKFAAALTDQQPSGYLRRLPPDVDGMLLVVAPTVRLATLWVELLRAVPELAPTAPSPSAVSTAGVLSVKAGAHTTLALVSWRSLVSRVLDALRTADESSLACDAEQLLALTETMDSAAFAPLRPGDLGARTARQIAQLQKLINAARSHIATDSPIAEPCSNQSSDGRVYFGWYIRSQRTKKAIWYGFWPYAWARHGLSPLWAHVKVSPSWSRQRLLQALSGLHEVGQAGMFEDGAKSFLIPLTIPEFAGEDEVVDSLRSQLESVISRLDSVVPEGEHVTPDQPDIGNTDDDPGETE